MKWLCLVIAWILVEFPLHAEESLLRIAEDQYRQGIASRDDFRQAIPWLKQAVESYQTIWEGGQRSTSVAINLARLHSLLEQFPEAMQWYRRAELLDPFDPGIRSEQQKLRSSLRIPTAWQRQSAGTWLRDSSVITGILVVIASCNLLACLLCFLRYLNPLREQGWLIGFAWCISMGLSLLVFDQFNRIRIESQQRMAIVRDAGATMRIGNGTLYPVRLNETLPPGCEVELIHERGNWSFVELSDGTRGRVPSDQLLEASINR